MEARRDIKRVFLIVICGLFVADPFFILAYEPETTHKALTKEILHLFKYYDRNKIDSSEEAIIIEGSADEDIGLRPLNHFYDPIHRIGLHSGVVSLGIAAPDWAKNTAAQAVFNIQPYTQKMYGSIFNFFSSDSDYSWDRAIYEYAWGNEERGLTSLGHVLHLLEDMSVPDHTRNDKHPPYLDTLLHQASPYEHWANKFNIDAIDVLMIILGGKPHPTFITEDTVDDYFENIADYSNRNFFSKSTINNGIFLSPNLLSLRKINIDGRIYAVPVGEESNYLFRIHVNGNKATKVLNDELVLQNYWNRLSKEAVLHGAGVVKLFFDEVEKERQAKVLYNKNRPWAGRVLDKTREGVFNLANALYGITSPYNFETLEEIPNRPVLIPAPIETPVPAGVDESARMPTPAASGPPAAVSEESAGALSPLTSQALPPTNPENESQTSTTSEPLSISEEEESAQFPLPAATTPAAISTTTPERPPMPEPEIFVSAPLYRRGPEPATSYTPSAMDIVINEIAWAGTAASTTADEWIELYNRSSRTISLDGWILRSATDEKPYLNLAGTIASGGYYLIERTDDNTVKNITADFTAAFGSGTGMGLVDSGEVLSLQYGSTTIDQTPALGECAPNAWCGGNTAERKTMERIEPGLTGTEAASWGANNGLIRNGSSTDGIALNATPKARNSRNYYISQTGTVSSNTTLASSQSPYFIDTGGLTISSGAILTINPGVVIKIYGNSAGITVNGTLKSLGSSGSNIVFTSFYDDDYGGDMNSDGSATSPAVGDWQTITFNSGSQNSELTYTRVRYGGRWYAGQTAGHALLKAEDASLTVSSSVFEKSMQYGIWLLNSTSTISNSAVQNNSVDSLSYGILMEGGANTVQNNTVTSNAIGIRQESAGSPTISGNTVNSSTNEAISIVSSIPTLSSNSASANGINGVLIAGNLASNYTFSSNLPYVVDSTLTLISGKTFNTAAGTVFKGKTSSAAIEIQGIFNISGSSGNPVVFTSLKDDDYGGDTNSDGSTSSPQAGDWRAVNFSSTATSSAVSYALVRYGGGDSSVGAMSLDSVGVDVSNSTFEYNKYKGLRLSNATSTLSGLTIRNTTGGGEPAGLYIESGSRAVVRNSAFNNNTYGILSTGGSTAANGGGNTFSGNTNNTYPTNLWP